MFGTPDETFPELRIRPNFFGDEAGEKGGGDKADERAVGFDCLNDLRKKLQYKKRSRRRGDLLFGGKASEELVHLQVDS